MQDYKRQVVIIGGGAAGLSLGSVLSRLGFKATLVDKGNNLGGDCLHYGCVPSKSFIRAAKMAYISKCSKKYGVDTEVSVDFKNIQNYINSVIATIQKRDDPLRFKSYGIDVIKGRAHFVGEHMLSIDDTLIPARRFIIATGSSPYIPNIKGLDKVNYYTNENILNIDKQPENLIIIGGGTIGLEYAQAFARLGTKVTIIESMPSFMGHLDQIQMATLQLSLVKQGVDFISGANIANIEKTNNNQIKLNLIIKDNQDDTSYLEEKKYILGDTLLIAIGRKPNVEHLGLDLVGIDYNNNGIITDDYLRTGRKHIYAIGDVVDCPYKFTHVSEYHSNIVIKNLAYKLRAKVNYKTVPRVIYTDPEWAQVGITEYEANKKNISHQVLHYQLNNLDRAIIAGEVSGSIKLIVRKNKLLGASILCPMAGELIHELALAIDNNISLSKIISTIHAYPSWSQMHKNAIDKYFEPKLFGSLSRFYVRLMQLFD